MTAAQQLEDLLGLQAAPVALAFRATPPEGIPRVPAAGPSGCSYWKLAADGQRFYTEAPDHYSCPVGAYTHGIDLPPEQGKELEGLIGTMVQLSYLRPEEIPSIPRREAPFGVAIYAPLADAPCDPDVVLIRGNAKQVMLLAEAAQAAGAGGALMGRPTCAAIPEAMRAGRSVASLGCIGNRVYTDLADDELYFALPGAQVATVVEQLATIVHANRELEAFHRGRQAECKMQS
jgi:uncharacterized protein (DUF169 family)